MDLRPGDTIYGPTKDETYTIISPIGQGGFGIVFEIRDENDARFALKTISTAWLDEVGVRALHNEGQQATEIRHQNVIPVYFYHDGEQYSELPPYTIMELADGGSILELIDSQRISGTHFPHDELLAMFSQLGNGMSAVSERLVHRDIKPDNILIHNDTLKISDFGLSKIVGASTRSQSFKGIQHLRYMAPEAGQFEENKPTMDMYSMGIVFYELATLKHPYVVDTAGDQIIAWKEAHETQVPADPRDYNPLISLGTAQLIMKMIEKRPQSRYSSWEEVLERISTSSSDDEASPDVSRLVTLAIEKGRRAEVARIALEKRTGELKDFERRVNYSFREIAEAAQEIVDAFNKASETTQLEIEQRTGLSLVIKIRNDSSNELKIKVRYAYDGEHQLRRRETILAWGYACVPSGSGINLVLAAETDDDLYGKWMSLFNRYRVGQESPRQRPTPFFFDFDDLPKEIKIAGTGTAHVFVTDIMRFAQAHLSQLLEQIVQ